MSTIGDYSEPKSPSLPGASKQTIYMRASEMPMEPKLSLKAIGQEYAPQQRESTYRKTQPTFHISLEKTPVKGDKHKPRAETPSRRSLSKSKPPPSDQKDLLKEIANTQERRRHNLYVQHNRRFRNTANSFASDDYAGDSSKPDSQHGFTATAMGNKAKPSKPPAGNDDLADVNLDKKMKEIKSSFTKQRTTDMKRKQSSNDRQVSPQMTNLTQAYTEGVSNLFKLLPFQQPVIGGPGSTAYQKPPIVSSSVELKTNNNRRLAAFQNPQLKQHEKQQLQALQESGKSLHLKGLGGPLQISADLSSRKTIKLPFPSKGLRNVDDSKQNSNRQLTSNRSLQQSGYSLHGIHSSIFRVEPVQDYTDLKLDFTSQKHITEYQSTQFLDSTKMKGKTSHKKSPRKNQGEPTKVRIKNQAGIRSSAEEMKLPKMPFYIQNQRSKSPRKQVTKNLTGPSKTSTERKIQTILDGADYHKLRQHKDPADNDTNCEDDLCTCLNHDPIISKQKPYQLSQSIDYSLFEDQKSMRMSTPPKMAKNKPIENVLSIQLRPLKGKALHLKEYKSMIQEEYGKEKKKQIYETMIPRTAKPAIQLDHMQSTDLSTAIKLNLRLEKKNEFLKHKRNNHVRLQTISPRGHVEKEEFLKMDHKMAEKMNTTVGSFVVSQAEEEQDPLMMRKSASPWRQSSKKTLKKQFYLFSPQNQHIVSQRYAADQIGVDRLSQKSSIVNLEIATGDGKTKQQNNQGNQINLGYVGLSHEQKLANEYFKHLMQDEVQFESMTEMVSQQNMPFGQIYSRLSKNASKVSQQTPKLASVKDEKSSIKSKTVTIDQPSENQTTLPNASKQTTPKQSQKQPKRAKPHKRQSSQPAPFILQTKISQTRVAPKNASPPKGAPSKSTSSKKVPPLKLQKVTNVIKKMIEGTTQPTQTTEVTRANNSSLLKIPEQQAKEAPQDLHDGSFQIELSDHSVSIPRFTNLDGVKSNEMYSNPTEVDINQKTLLQLSQQDWLMRIKRQQEHQETLQRVAFEKEAHMGPLERKTISIKQPVNNHKQISQISLIDEFYQSKDAFIPEPKLSTSPFLNTGFSNNRYRTTHDVDEVDN